MARVPDLEVRIDTTRLRQFTEVLREAGVAAGAAASAVGNVGQEAIGASQRLDRDMARLDAVLREYGCRGVRATNRGDHIIFEAAFPDNVPGYSIPSRLIHDSVDWVDLVAQRFIDFIQQGWRNNDLEIDVPEMDSLNEYFDSLRGWTVSYSVGYAAAFLAANTQSSLITLEVTFQEGEVEQRIDTGRYCNERHEYLNRLYRELHRAHQLLIGDERGWHQRQDFESIVSVMPTQRIPPGFLDDFYHPRRGPYHNGSRFTDEENNRARDLLVSCLNDEQREVFERYNFFDITGQSGEKYRIKHGKAYNVTRLSDDVDLCAGPADNVPVYDYMLAQKIWLEADEVGFLEDANERRGFFGLFGGEVEYTNERCRAFEARVFEAIGGRV